MIHQIVCSPTAKRDLERVWSEVYAASLNLKITQKYLDDLLDRVEGKAEFQQSGSPLYYENCFTGDYFVVFKAYIAFYRIVDDTMFIERILFGRSDYMKYLPLDVPPSQRDG